MLTASADTLAEDYYLRNFHQLASLVVGIYHDILSAEERQWYATLQSATEPAQRLYIRLLTRKGSVFRLSRLHYPEIANPPAAAAELAAQGLADTAAPQDLSILLQAFTKPELLDLLGTREARGRPRAELVAQWLSHEGGERQRFIDSLQQVDDWLTLLGHQYWNVYRLCFFGNLYQDASEFVLRELGTVQYENYPLTTDARAFSSREQLMAHLCCFECEALYETVDPRSSDQLLTLAGRLPATFSGDEHLRRRIDRCRNRIARQLERLGDVDAAQRLYACSCHPPARERRVRLLMAGDRSDEAARLLHELLAGPFNDAEAHTGRRLQRQLNRLLGQNCGPRQRFRPQSTILTLSKCPQRVELAAREFYSRFGTCRYTENSLVSGVLGLFIWDIIFHPVAGAFFNPFQSAPADFHQAEFSRRRATQLAQRFRELDDVEAFSVRVMNTFVDKHGLANPLVRWARLDKALLRLALTRIPSAHWRVLLRRVLSDLRENTSGLPDLVLFRDDGEYEFIEIKGPGDSLQQNQLRWMQYFDQHRIPCRVVQVRWAREIDSRQ